MKKVVLHRQNVKREIALLAKVDQRLSCSELFQPKSALRKFHLKDWADKNADTD
jgi:hypothetical protein